ncbi:hypothetical protein L1887_63471 [Cichorium endivia]|nr:hypothetical protein L1887_63471 [Cichorium endivia]
MPVSVLACLIAAQERGDALPVRCAYLLPEQALPRWECCGFEKRVFENGFDTTKRLNYIGAVGVQIPQFAVVTLTCPPEGIRFLVLIDLELGSGPKSLVERKGGSILLEQSVDSGQTTVPRVFQIFKSQAAVLLIGLHTLLAVLGPNALRVDELGLPRDNVTEDVGDESLLVMVHAGTVVCSAAGRHEDLSDPVIELGNVLFGDLQERVRCALLGLVIDQSPNGVLNLELIVQVPALGQNSNFETVHSEEQVRIVPRVDRSECVVPLDGGHAARQAVLHVPEDSTSKIARVISFETEEDPDLVDVASVETNGVSALSRAVAELQEVVWRIGWASNLTGALKAKQQEVNNETVVLEDECRELKTADHARRDFGIRGLDPSGEKATLISLVPQILIEVCVGDLLDWLNVVDRVDGSVIVVHVDSDFFEGALGKKEALDSGERGTWTVVCLLNQSELLTLALVQTTLHAVCFTQTFKGEDENFGVVLVAHRWKGIGWYLRLSNQWTAVVKMATPSSVLT